LKQPLLKEEKHASTHVAIDDLIEEDLGTEVDYKGNFERRVLRKIDKDRQMVAHFTTLLSIMIMGLNHFCTPKNRVTMTIIIVSFQTCCALIGWNSNALVMRKHAKVVDAVLHAHLHAFQKEILSRCWVVRQFPNHFKMRTAQEVEVLLRKQLRSMDEDESLQDEIHIMNDVNQSAYRLRHKMFTLRDLSMFFETSDLVLLESSWIDVLATLQQQLECRMSKDMAAFFAEQRLGYFEIQWIRKQASLLVHFVLTGELPAVRHAVKADKLNQGVFSEAILHGMVSRMLEAGERDDKNPRSVWEYRMIAFVAQELRAFGTTYMASLLEHFWKPYGFLEVQFTTDINLDALDAELAESADHPGMVLGALLEDEQYVPEDMRVSLEQDADIRMGCSADYRTDIAAVAVQGRGTLIMRMSFTIDHVTSHQVVNVSRDSGHHELLGLLKTSTSTEIYKVSVSEHNSSLFLRLFLGAQALRDPNTSDMDESCCVVGRAPKGSRTQSTFQA